jgi:ABC-type multidrug transport system ATPase subunit
MEVILQKATRRFGREEIFSNVDHTFSVGSRTAILGPNGSGKSTLLQLIAGAILPTSGSVEYRQDGALVLSEEIYRHVSIASPYMGLYEDLALEEAIVFHARFKPFRNGLSTRDVAAICYLEHALKKPVAQFSSGMKQRLKLALAILSHTPLLLLDEPASNLDSQAITWFRRLLQEHLQERILVVASNRLAHEHDMCTETIEMEALKSTARAIP